MKQKNAPTSHFGYYLGYLSWLGLLLIPLFILFIVWFNYLSLQCNAVVLAFLGLVCLSTVWREALERYTLEYELAFNTPDDISHEMLVPDEGVQEAFQRMKALGFTSLGEISTKPEFLTKPSTTWVFINEEADVCLEIVRPQDEERYSLRFSSWFMGYALVETVYPIGETIRDKDYSSEAINSRLESVFDSHMRRVVAFEGIYGETVQIESIEQFLAFEQIYRETFAPRLHHRARNRFFALKLSEVSIFGAAFYVGALSCVSLTQVGSRTEVMIPITLSIGLFCVAFMTRSALRPPKPPIEPNRRKFL
jgi:hypothetical protein